VSGEEASAPIPEFGAASATETESPATEVGTEPPVPETQTTIAPETENTENV
jgi:hypothetical protein